MSDNAYDDELSETELASLAAQDASDKKITDAPDGNVPGVLPDDADPADQIAEAEANAPQKTPAPTPPAEPADPNAPPPPPPPADPAAEDLAAFIERHKDKSPAELAELIANRTKRGNKQQFQQRRGKTPDQIRSEREQLQARRTTAQQGTQAFQEKLANDPDAAAADLHEKLSRQEMERIAAEEAALDAEEANARFESAIEIADKYIPEFRTVYPEIVQFAADIGYSQQEIDGIDDGRDLIILNLARMAGRLMQSKVIDTTGKLLPSIKPANDTPQDPRLAAPAPIQTHGGSQGTGAALTLEQQAANATTMSDEDFDKLSPEMLNKLMGGR